MGEKILKKENKVKRHSLSVILVHWSVAISTLLLLFSGFGQMPMYRRYGLVNVPGFSWSDNFVINSQIHYAAAIVLLLAVTYHIIYHVSLKQFDIFPKRGDLKESYLIIKAMLGFGKEPASDKYLAEQRLAYFFIGLNLLILIITGLIKVYKNFSFVNVNYDFMIWVTLVHNIATFLLLFGIIGHLAAFIFKENRPLLRGMFTGKVDLDYVKHRHGLWYEKLLKGSSAVDNEKIRGANNRKQDAKI
ncbi:formate dehydrogenase subunit gamma [Desulfitibacter alkalitolerans]|uniref:formate dehydrogenase subunit gamma n=1 Tax=Desulfitibacter alkalitolerans TaxID=264641 RepID=UPI000487D865|nr:cytochrome b/b6 domain-containing protein [Desulfitibacter alkalitolerans]